jgi:hypothetical protein
VDTLPFVVEGLMTLDYEEIYEIYGLSKASLTDRMGGSP